MTRVRLSLLLCLITAGACGSSYTIVDRAQIQVSSNSAIVAGTLLPQSERFPALVKHLALAEEVYSSQLGLLRERRNKVRARKRDLNFASYGLMGASALGVGGLAVGTAAGGGDTNRALVGAGALSLVGLGLGTILQLTAAMQEETSVADEKLRTLQRAHESMLERVRSIIGRTDSPAEAAQIQAQAAGVIDSFINEALQINVKG